MIVPNTAIISRNTGNFSFRLGASLSPSPGVRFAGRSLTEIPGQIPITLVVELDGSEVPVPSIDHKVA